MNKILMMVIDGIGFNDNQTGNVIKEAEMGNLSDLYNEFPHSLLNATGDAVGLPDGVTADSEIAHVAFGSGKKVKQDVTILNETLGSTLIEKNDFLISIVKKLNKTGNTLHLAGLVSDGRVSSDIRYMETLITHLKNMGLEKMYFHAITDGVDTKESAITFLDRISKVMEECELGKLATICGRSFALDKDNNWNKTKVYSDLLFEGVGANIRKYQSGIEACYKRNLTDDLIPPITLVSDPTIKTGDIFLWLNYNINTSRQFLKAITDDNFTLFTVNKPENIDMFSLLQVDNIDIDYLIEDEDEFYSIGTYFSYLGMRQARISTKERYPMVTYFFDGYNNEKLANCDTFLIPSIQDDMVYQDTIDEVTKQVIKCVEKDYNFILVDIPYADIVSKSGSKEELLFVLRNIDQAIGKIYEAVEDNFYKMIITSSYGNVEETVDKIGNENFGSTSNPVPFIITDSRLKIKNKGDITMVAPTILKYMDIALPKQMSQVKSLIDDEG